MCLPGYLAIFPPTPGTKHRKIGFWAAPVASPQPHPCATTCHIRLLDQRLVTGRCFQDKMGHLTWGTLLRMSWSPLPFLGGGGGACGQRCVDSKNSQTAPTTTSTTPNTPTIGRYYYSTGWGPQLGFCSPLDSSLLWQPRDGRDFAAFWNLSRLGTLGRQGLCSPVNSSVDRETGGVVWPC